MPYVHRVLKVHGKNAEVLQRELDEAGQEDFHVVAVTGTSDRSAEMVVLEKRIRKVSAPQHWAPSRRPERPAAASVPGRLGRYDD
ncbi:MAG TPA: hypothetical protein VKT83_17970 [bacterium]|nr:hypothetical protein [bacterium]